MNINSKYQSQIEKDIKSLKIQGATNIAISVLDALEGFLKKTNSTSSKDLCSQAYEFAYRLAYARPNEPLAQNAIKYVFFSKNRPAGYYLKKIDEYKILISETKKQIVEFASNLIPKNCTVLTHCHSSVVAKTLIEAKRTGKEFFVICTETRPLFQGRITAKELIKENIDTTMIVDSLAVSKIFNRKNKINAVLIGSDLLSKEGFINKVGTFGIVSAASKNNIPVYVIASLLKFDEDFTPLSEIEERKPDEIWPNAPQNLKITNPAFDFTPYNNGIKIICEKGIIDPINIQYQTHKTYSFL